MTTTSSEKKKKTRELPNLTECHCCHLRVDLAKSSKNNKLQILYSEWRIVLLCNKCLARVESTELCSCFNDSSFGHCFSCRQCKRRVHRDCGSEYRSAAVWFGSLSAAADQVSVCADCWVSESLARWRRSRNISSSGRKNMADLGLGRSRVLNYERKCDPNSTDSSTEDGRGSSPNVYVG